MALSRSSHFFKPQINYQSLASAAAYTEFDIEDGIRELTRGYDSALSRDAVAYKSALDKLRAQKTLLAKAGTVQKNIKMQTLKYQNEITRFETLLLGTMSDSQRVALLAKQAATEKSLHDVTQLNNNVAREIPRIEAAMNELQRNLNQASLKFAGHYPWQHWINKKIYQSYLAVEFAFVPYNLKTSDLSFISFAQSWKLPIPSSFQAYLLASPFTFTDLLVNLLMFDPDTSATRDIYKYFEQHRFKSYSQVVLDSLRKAASEFTIGGFALALFNFIAKETHNITGGVSTIYGISGFWLLEAMGDWKMLVYAILLAECVGYYGSVLNEKYDAGMQDFIVYKRLLNTVNKLFSADFPRAFDVLYRGMFCNAFLRALSFYFLAAQFKEISPQLAFVDPLVVFGLVFHHSIACRFGTAYNTSFAKSEHELVQIFVDLKIKKAREQVQLLHSAHDDLDLEALKLAADMTVNYTQYARLTVERERERALARVKDKAREEAAEYLKFQTDEILELRTWKDEFEDFCNCFVIGSLRGMFGYTLMSTYGMKLLHALLGEHLSGENAAYVEVVSSTLMGMIFFSIYFNSCKQSELDARVVGCFTDDQISQVDEIIATEQATEVALEVAKRATPMLHAREELELKEVEHFALEQKAEEPAEESPHEINMHTSITFTNISEVIVAGGSSVIRVVSNVYPTLFAFIGLMDERALVILITLSLAEASALNYKLFIPDIHETILSKVTRSKFFQSMITKQTVPETNSTNNTQSSYINRMWSMFKPSVQNDARGHTNHESTSLLNVQKTNGTRLGLTNF